MCRGVRSAGTKEKKKTNLGFCVCKSGKTITLGFHYILVGKLWEQVRARVALPFSMHRPATRTQKVLPDPSRLQVSF